MARRRTGLPSLVSLSMHAFRIGVEAQAVVGLRLFQAATGRGSVREMTRMIDEKVGALVQAQEAAALAIAGGEPALAASRVLSVYGRRVRANRRRLIGGG